MFREPPLAMSDLQDNNRKKAHVRTRLNRRGRGGRAAYSRVAHPWPDAKRGDVRRIPRTHRGPGWEFSRGVTHHASDYYSSEQYPQ
jgi:hypothetical protein